MTKEEAIEISDEIYDIAVARYLNSTDWSYEHWMTTDEFIRYVEAYKVAYGEHPYGDDYEAVIQDPNNDLFLFAECKRARDVEDSIERYGLLVCPECVEKEDYEAV